MTSDQVAELLGHNPERIRIWAKEGTLPASRGANGRRHLFWRDKLIDWIRQHRVVPED